MPSLLIRPGIPHEVCQLSTMLISFADNKGLNDNTWLNISSMVRFGRRTEKTTEFDIVLAYSALSGSTKESPHSLSILSGTLE